MQIMAIDKKYDRLQVKVSKVRSDVRQKIVKFKETSLDNLGENLSSLLQRFDQIEGDNQVRPIMVGIKTVIVLRIY